MLVDIEGLRATAASLNAAASRLTVVRYEALATLDLVGQRMNGAGVGAHLGAALDAVTAVAASANARAQLAAEAEQTFTATLLSARRDADVAALRLVYGGRGAEQGREGVVDEALVAGARARISDALRTGGTRVWFLSIGDTDVSREDLAVILSVLEGLNPAEIQRVYWQLGEEERTRLVVELYGGQILDRVDRLRYLGLLAGGLNGAQLLEMLEGLGGDGDELASAIGRYAPPRVAGEVMRTIGSGAGDRSERIDQFNAIGGNLLVEVLEDVLAVGYGKGWLFGMLERSFVVDRYTSPNYMGGPATTQYEYDPTATLALLGLVNRSSSVDLRADAWVAAVRLLEEPLAKAATRFETGLGYSVWYSFTDGSGSDTMAMLSALMLNQPLEMFDRLRLRADESGDASADFFREVLRGADVGISKEGALAVNQLFGELLGGDPAVAAEFFLRRDPAVGGGVDYRNAIRLGFAAATVSRGLDSLEPSGDDAEKVLGLVLGLADFGPVSLGPFKAGTDIVFYISDQIAAQELERLRADADTFQRLLMNAIVPRDLEGNRYEVDAVEEFEGAYMFIIGQTPRNGD